MWFFWLLLTIILLGGWLLTKKFPEKKEEFANGLSQWFQLLFPIDWDNRFDKIEKDNVRALMKRSTISQLLHLRAYRSLSETSGIYELSSGRKGIGFEIECQTYTNEEVATQVRKALLGLGVDDLAVQFIVYASDNVEDFIESAKGCFNLSGLNIENSKELEKIGKERIEKTETWSKSSMHKSNFATFKARNMINLITVIFPRDVLDKRIQSYANDIRGKLELAGLHPRNLTPKQVVRLYSEILKEGSIEGIDYDPFMEMNIQLTKRARIRFKQDSGILNIGKTTFAKVFTTEKFPIQTTPTDVSSAFFDFRSGVSNPLPSRFLLTTTIHVEKQSVLTDEVLDKARFNILRAGDEEAQKKSTEVSNVINESRMLVRAIEEQDERPYLGMWSLIIFEDNIDELEARAGKIKSAFDKIPVGGWKIAEEQMGTIAYLVMLYSLPFQFDLQAKEALNRYNLLFSSNVESILPLMGSFRGFTNPVIKFFGRTGQCVGIDLWCSDTNYNCCIIGDSGTGKSFLSNTIQSSNLQNGIKTFIVDKGNSYLGFCEAIGGEYITFGEDVKTGLEKDICLNFFTNIVGIKAHISDVEEGKITLGNTSIEVSRVADADGYFELIDAESMQQIMPIVLIMAGLAKEEEGVDLKEFEIYLENALQIAFIRMGRNAGMKDVCTALQEQEKAFKTSGNKNFVERLMKLGKTLENYGSETGRYYKYFNGAYNIDSTKDFVVLECDDLVSKGQELYNVVIMSAILRNMQEMYADKMGSRKRIIVIDEATPLLKDETIAKFLGDMARRVRKHNGALMIITQKSEDFNSNEFGRAIWGNSAHKFCLAMDSSEIEIAYSDNGLFKGSLPIIKEMAKTIKNHKPHFSECLYFYGGGAYPLILKVGGLEYAMFTSDAKDKQRMEGLRVNYSLSFSDSRTMFGYIMDGMSEDEAHKKVLQGDQAETTRYWTTNMRNALQNKRVTANFEYFYDKDHPNPIIVRAEPMIKLAENEYYRFTQFEKIANENGFTAPIFDDFLDVVASIDLDYIIIQVPYKVMDAGFLTKIREKINKSQVMISCSVANCEKYEKGIEEYVAKSKELGFFFFLEGVNLNKISLELMNKVKPDFIELENHPSEREFMNFLGSDYRFVKRNVNSLKDFERAVDNGYLIFSGNYFNKGIEK